MLRLISQLLALKSGPAVEEIPVPAPQGRRRKRRTEDEFTSYYGRPVIKKPHWIWPVWVYFWAGGIAGGASAIAALTELFGDKERDKGIIRAGHYISMAGMLVSPVMLIVDLQRPERFHHMLRILKLRSPLSVGTYILTSTGILSGLNTARQVVEDGFIPANTPFGQFAILGSNPVTRMAQGLDGMALGSYTGVLLSATAVPLWAETATILPPLFLCSAFSTGAAAISLLRAVTGEEIEELHRLDRIEQGAILSELALLGYAAFKLKPEVRQPALSGLNKTLFAGAIGLGQLGPLLLQAISPKHGPLSRIMAIISSLMALTGGFLLRVAVIEAGKATAESAQAYHATTRGKGRATPEEQAARYGR